MTDERPQGFNTLAIESKPGDRAVRFSIDANPLEALVTRAERGAGARHPGDYVLLPADLAYLPSEHLLGHATRDTNWGDDWARYGFGPGVVAVGGCDSGSVGCHPLVVAVEVSEGMGCVDGAR